MVRFVLMLMGNRCALFRWLLLVSLVVTYGCAAETATPDEPSVDEASIDKASTSAELKALLKRAPKDERVLKKLAKTLAKEPDGLTESLSTLKSLYAAMPKALEDRDLQQIVVRAATTVRDPRR